MWHQGPGTYPCDRRSMSYTWFPRISSMLTFTLEDMPSVPHEVQPCGGGTTSTAERPASRSRRRVSDDGSPTAAVGPALQSSTCGAMGDTDTAVRSKGTGDPTPVVCTLRELDSGRAPMECRFGRRPVLLPPRMLSMACVAAKASWFMWYVVFLADLWLGQQNDHINVSAVLGHS